MQNPPPRPGRSSSPAWQSGFPAQASAALGPPSSGDIAASASGRDRTASSDSSPSSSAGPAPAAVHAGTAVPKPGTWGTKQLGPKPALLYGYSHPSETERSPLAASSMYGTPESGYRSTPSKHSPGRVPALRGKRPSHPSDSDELLEYKLEDVSMEVDTYSYLFLTLVQNMKGPPAECERRRAKTVRLNLLHAFLACIVAVAMQIAVAWFLITTNDGMIDNAYFKAQFDLTLEEAAGALRHAEVHGAHLPAGVLDECARQLRVGHQWIYYVALGAWIFTMVIELKRAIWLALHILGIDSRDAEIMPLMSFQRDKDSVIVERLEETSKFFIILLVPGCRIVVGCIVAWIGVKFLIYQTDPANLVLKVLAIQLIIKINELAAHSLLTMGMLKEVQRAKIKTNFGHPGDHTLWDNGLGGLVYSFICLLALFVITEVFFGPLMHFRSACAVYHDKFGIMGVHAPHVGAFFGHF